MSESYQKIQIVLNSDNNQEFLNAVVTALKINDIIVIINPFIFIFSQFVKQLTTLFREVVVV